MILLAAEFAKVSGKVLEELRKIPTPAIANAIEAFEIRPRNVGFCDSRMHPVFADVGPIAGYATTLTVGADLPYKAAKSADRSGYWKHILSVPEPRIAVVRDMDEQPVGAFWGEVNANVHLSLGCIGTVTHGGVRDLEEVEELGFAYFATDVLVSHASVYMIDYGIPVNVCGLVVSPGDLLVCDIHGVINVPMEIAEKIPEMVKKQAEAERIVIDYCSSGNVSVEGLSSAWNQMEEARRALSKKKM